MKTRNKFLATLFLLVLIGFISTYFLYMSPQQRAAKHLAYIYDAINQMHPAILEADAVEFNEWHKKGYEQAKALLPNVHSVNDELALINFYFAGFKDAHLNGWLNYSPFLKFDSNAQQWTGWVLTATQSGYEVVFRRDEKDIPPKKSKIISCDGKPIDQLLQESYAPYIDLRWTIPLARDKTAKSLTLTQFPILNRPAIKQCEFLIDGNKVSYALHWSNISTEDSKQINETLYSNYVVPSLREIAPNSYWIRVSDFQLNSPEGFAAHQKLLADLQTQTQKDLVVLDLRSNGGGDSSHGYEILNTLLAVNEQVYLHNKREEKMKGADALYRASWYSYWSDKYQVEEKIVKIQGADSSLAKYKLALLARMKKALEAGEKTFSQSDVVFQSKVVPLQPTDNQYTAAYWESKTKLVLLTDRHCVSACLDFVDSLKLIPNLLHLGETTDADTVYTEISYMQSKYLDETFNFMVPVKRWSKRLRKDNEPYVPNFIYDGDMNDDSELEQWVLLKAQEFFK